MRVGFLFLIFYRQSTTKSDKYQLLSVNALGQNHFLNRETFLISHIYQNVITKGYNMSDISGRRIFFKILVSKVG